MTGPWRILSPSARSNSEMARWWPMNVGDTFRLATANLVRRKERTALTSAGVVVGVASLVLMVSLGLGVQHEVVRFFDSDEALRTLTVHRVKGDAGKKRGGGFLGFGL